MSVARFSAALKHAPNPVLAAAILNLIFVALAAIERNLWTWGVALELVACVAAAVAVYAPTTGSLACIAVLAGAVLVGDSTGVGAFSSLLVIATLGIEAKKRMRIAVTTAAYLVLLWWTWTTLRPGESIVQYALFWIGCIATAWAIGNSGRTYLLRSKEQWQQQLREQRRGIARDLHDTVAHSLSLIVMRTEQSRLKGHTSADDLQFIAATADRSIQDLRSMMELLRKDEQLSAPEIWQVESVDEVVAASERRLRRHGFKPIVRLEGDLDRLPSSLNEALSKVTHEATTNIIKHAAPHTSCALLVEVGDSDAELVVTSVPMKDPVPRTHIPMGLDGMRERIQALGGEFSAGPGAERWITQARLPLR